MNIIINQVTQILRFPSACVCVRTQSCPTLQPHGLEPTRLLCPRDFSGKNTGVACYSLLQFPVYISYIYTKPVCYEMCRTSLVVQWWRFCLPMETQVLSLVREDPADDSEATKPECHNYWTCALEPGVRNCWAHRLPSLKPERPRARALQRRSRCPEKPARYGEEQSLLTTAKRQHSQK